ncbi:hypothetical protein QC764_0002840 [Podospora pseudoanserina]|uniref:Uncharacterized protein n=1 Tax=Podospora pseudoanserina TaxID=2609844 RepID=A0ABR0IK85_9PEZI|nr:hypothetical protein QC764_0002840 [Podospora pseudoanserina]
MSKPSFFFQPHILPHHTHHHITSPTSTSLSLPIPLQTATVAWPCLASHMQKIDCWQPFGDATKDVPRAPPFVKKGVHHCHCDLPLERRIAGPTSKRPESPYWGCAKWQPEGQHGACDPWIWEGDMDNAHRKWERENGSEPCVTKR